MRATGGLCFEVLLGTWESDPFLDDFVLIGNDVLSCIAKSLYRTGSDPHVPGERHRPLMPSTLAARTPSLVEHTLSKIGGDPYPVRRGIAAVVECYVRNTRYSRCWVNRTRESRALCEFQHHKGITCFVFCFLERYLLASCSGKRPTKQALSLTKQTALELC